MSSAPLTCPECAGERMLGPSGDPQSVHPAGILTIQHNPGCTLRDREDATRVADYCNAMNHTETNVWGDPRGQFKRPVTPTELTILTSWSDRLNTIDHERPNEETLTYITGLTAGVINRSWPSLWTWFPPAYDTLLEADRKRHPYL